jgi:hypothetical protein
MPSSAVSFTNISFFLPGRGVYHIGLEADVFMFHLPVVIVEDN